MTGFVAGFAAPFRGFLRLAARPRLWPLAAAPVALNVLLCAGLGYAWFGVVEPRAEKALVEGLGLGAGWVAALGAWAVFVVMLLAALPLLLGVYVALAGVVGGPFYDVLCAATEAEVLGEKYETPRRGFVAGLAAGLRCELGNLVVAVVGGLLAFAASFVAPPFGLGVATGLGWFLAGFGYLAYPFDRRALTLGSKLKVVLRRLDVALGFGCATYVLLLPVVTAPFVAPCAVVGAALLFPGARRGGVAR